MEITESCVHSSASVLPVWCKTCSSANTQNFVLAATWQNTYHIC